MKPWDAALVVAALVLVSSLTSRHVAAAPLSTASYTSNFSFMSTADGGFTEGANIPIQGFDPALGTLTAAHFRFSCCGTFGDTVTLTNLGSNTLYNLQVQMGVTLALDGAALWDGLAQSSVITFRTLRNPFSLHVPTGPYPPLPHGSSEFGATSLAIVTHSASSITNSSAQVSWSWGPGNDLGTLTDPLLLAALNDPGTVDLDLILEAGVKYTLVTLGIDNAAPSTLLNGRQVTGTVEVRYEYEPASVPEPASVAMMGAGLAGVGVARRRRSRR